MPTTKHVTPRDGDVLLMVGTMKGVFLMRSNGARARWETAGPYFPGQAIYSLALDQRNGTRRMWAGGASDHWGPGLRWSDDLGRTWSDPDHNLVKFPEEAGASVARIWQIRPGTEPGVLYAGTEPAALFRSRDNGRSWSLVQGLWDHPHRPQWQPGGGGQCLHTIVLDPSNRERITVAISTGGVYRSDDGGRTWQARSKGVRAQFLPEGSQYPEFGQCVHKVVHHPTRPERLFLQNHWGLYRSDDAGDSWTDIANGVPSDFGFAMAMHPHDPDTVYILPIESDMYRCTPEGKLRVYRTRNAGKSWEALTGGLPQKDALECVLRDAMDTDPLNPAGVYFGTRRGEVWGSANGGSNWSRVIGGLPPVVCVKAVVVGDAARARGPRAAGAARTVSRKAARPRPTKRRAAGRKTASARGGRKKSAARGARRAKRAPSRGRKKR